MFVAWCHAGDRLPSAGVFAADDVVGEEDKGEQGEKWDVAHWLKGRCRGAGSWSS